jgi:hypothetical protein
MHEQEIGNTFGRAVHEYLFCSKAPCANLAIFSHFCRLAGSRASLSFAPINALIVAPYELPSKSNISRRVIVCIVPNFYFISVSRINILVAHRLTFWMF